MRYILLVILSLVCLASRAQLKPGFDKDEYMEMLRIAHMQHTDIANWNKTSKTPYPQQYKFAYRSPVTGLENMWDLWVSDKVAVISIRGTVGASASWLANVYAAMVPATGSLQLENNYTFHYQLSDDPKAAVHVGWLVSAGYLSRDILPRIDSCYKAGIHDFIITGHSQGAAISFLLTSHLASLQQQGRLPKDIRFKTYCSAAPKPGNLYYAYSYEHLTANGWGFTVVSSADWVPETPVSIQTVRDFNTTNPFTQAPSMIRKQKFVLRLALRHAYNRMSKPARKAQRAYERYLGRFVSKQVKKQLKEFQPPQYYACNNYMRAGSFIVLYADTAYYQQYPDSKDNIWQHHFIAPYLYLAQQLK